MQISPELIELIYDSAPDAGLVPRLLDELADSLHAGATALLYQNQLTREASGVISRMDACAMATFNDYYAARNPLTSRNNLAEARRSPMLPINLDENIIEKRDYQRTEYYSDFSAPNGMHHLLMMGLSVNGDSIATLNFGRTDRHDQFGKAEIGLLTMLRPHLSRAFRIAAELAVTKRTGDVLLDAMQSTHAAVILLDEAGRVLQANAQGEALLSAELQRQGELAKRWPEKSHELGRAIATACGVLGVPRSGGSISIPRAGRQPLHVVVTPLRREVSILGTGPAALVLAVDLDKELNVPQATARAVFGLTAAEARLAALLFDGLSPKQAAERLKVSGHTVHAQLYRIFEKTGVKRQSELIKLLARIAKPN